MHARSGSFRLSPDRLDDALRAFEEGQLPQYKEQSGYKGFTLLANRQTGQVLGISFWESQSDLQATDELGQQAREQLQERGQGQGDIERVDWEVVLDDTE
jgi:heme-degrading monooxygenase HmoA